MKSKSRAAPVHSIMWGIVCIFFMAGCAHRTVVVGSPYERYDHNRTQQIVFACGDERAVPKKVVTEVYTPYGTESFPKARYHDEQAPQPDDLPVANVVPVFTGVSLPLSAVALPKGQSDRSDLIDFLASGPRAKVGVEPPDLSGDLQEAESRFGPILDILSSKDQLTGEGSALMERLSQLRVMYAGRVRDSRYSEDSFKGVLAFQYEKFWFILYKLPASAHYSRLVIVPAVVRGQDLPGKRP